MEEVNPSQSADPELPHTSVNHSRPFFYVQPPSQPYYMYQWSMDPYGQYGFPGPVFPFGRPYVVPYQYMQYPGYVVPHAPTQPTEYRRLSPFLPSIASYDLRFRQHFQQTGMHREMTSAEAQTETRDPLAKATNILSGLRARDESGNVKESNVLSSTPHVTSYAEVKKLDLETVSRPERDDSPKLSTLGDSAVSSQGGLDDCVLSDVLPLDGSSVHEDVRDRVNQQVLAEGPNFTSMKATGLPGDNENNDDSAETQDSGAHGLLFDIRNMTPKDPASDRGERVENTALGSVEFAELPVQMSTDYDLPYQILHLPCDETTTGLLLQKVSSMMYMDPASALLPSKSYSFGSNYPYSYYPQVAPGRQSVLSPSLDELSSKDEMFSTDAEEDPMSGQVCVDSSKSEPAGSETERRHEPPSFCACCGASLPDEDENVSLPDSYDDREFDPEGDSQSTGDAQKTATGRRSSGHILPARGQQATRHNARTVQGVELTGQYHGHGERECGEQFIGAAKAERDKEKGTKGSQSRYSEHFQREGPGELLDQENWACANGKQRSRSCRPNNGLQEKGRPARRRPSCKLFAQQRPRRNEYDDHDEAEVSYSQRGRGTMKRRGTRY